MKKKHIIRIIVLGSALVLAGSLLLLFFFAGQITASLEGTKIDINAYYLSSSPGNCFTSPDINDYYLDFYEAGDGFQNGAKVSGRENGRIKSGTYEGGSLKGQYYLYRYARVKCVIILTGKEGSGLSTAAFNLGSETETRQFYQTLRQAHSDG